MALDDEHPFLDAALNPLPPVQHVGWRERWRRKALSTLVPLVWGENCCSSEWYAAVADIFGHYLVYPQETTAPTQADLLIVTGHVTEKAVPDLLDLVAAMPDPHFVMAVGACTQLGDERVSLANEAQRASIIAQAYAPRPAERRKEKNKAKSKAQEKAAPSGWAVEQRETTAASSLFLARPLDQIIPVDVVVAGCPPTPQALVQGVRLLEAMIKAGYRGQRPLV